MIHLKQDTTFLYPARLRKDNALYLKVDMHTKLSLLHGTTYYSPYYSFRIKLILHYTRENGGTRYKMRFLAPFRYKQQSDFQTEVFEDSSHFLNQSDPVELDIKQIQEDGRCL